MLEKQLAAYLAKSLSQFIQNISEEQLQVSVWSGDIVLHNVRLQPNIMEHVANLLPRPAATASAGDANEADYRMLLVPLTLVRGTVEDLVIQVPWSSLETEAVQVRASGVELVVGPLRGKAFNAAEEKIRQEAMKQEQLARYGEACDTMDGLTKLGDQRSSPEEESPRQPDDGSSSFSWLSFFWDFDRIGQLVARNCNVSLSRISIRYEFDYELLHPALASSISLWIDEAHVTTTDVEMNPVFSPDLKSAMCKALRLSGLSVGVHRGKKCARGYSSGEPYPDGDAYAQEWHFSDLLARLPELSGGVKVYPPGSKTGTIFGQLQAPLSGPYAELTAAVAGEVNFRASFGSLRTALRMWHDYRRGLGYAVHRRFLHLLGDGRKQNFPTDGATPSKARNYWRFAIACVVEEVQRHRQSSGVSCGSRQWPNCSESMMRFCKVRREYLLLFKKTLDLPWIPNATKRDCGALASLERQLSLEQVLFLRSLARAEVIVEAASIKLQRRLVEAAQRKRKASGPGPATEATSTSNQGASFFSWGWLSSTRESASTGEEQPGELKDAQAADGSAELDEWEGKTNLEILAEALEREWDQAQKYLTTTALQSGSRTEATVGGGGETKSALRRKSPWWTFQMNIHSIGVGFEPLYWETPATPSLGSGSRGAVRRPLNFLSKIKQFFSAKLTALDCFYTTVPDERDSRASFSFFVGSFTAGFEGHHPAPLICSTPSTQEEDFIVVKQNSRRSEIGLWLGSFTLSCLPMHHWRWWVCEIQSFLDSRREAEGQFSAPGLPKVSDERAGRRFLSEMSGITWRVHVVPWKVCLPLFIDREGASECFLEKVVGCDSEGAVSSPPAVESPVADAKFNKSGATAPYHMDSESLSGGEGDSTTNLAHIASILVVSQQYEQNAAAFSHMQDNPASCTRAPISFMLGALSDDDPQLTLLVGAIEGVWDSAECSGHLEIGGRNSNAALQLKCEPGWCASRWDQGPFDEIGASKELLSIPCVSLHFSSVNLSCEMRDGVSVFLYPRAVGLVNDALVRPKIFSTQTRSFQPPGVVVSCALARGDPVDWSVDKASGAIMIHTNVSAEMNRSQCSASIRPCAAPHFLSALLTLETSRRLSEHSPPKTCNTTPAGLRIPSLCDTRSLSLLVGRCVMRLYNMQEEEVAIMEIVSDDGVAETHASSTPRGDGTQNAGGNPQQGKSCATPNRPGAIQFWRTLSDNVTQTFSWCASVGEVTLASSQGKHLCILEGFQLGTTTVKSPPLRSCSIRRVSLIADVAWADVVELSWASASSLVPPPSAALAFGARSLSGPTFAAERAASLADKIGPTDLQIFSLDVQVPALGTASGLPPSIDVEATATDLTASLRFTHDAITISATCSTLSANHCVDDGTMESEPMPFLGAFLPMFTPDSLEEKPAGQRTEVCFSLPLWNSREAAETGGEPSPSSAPENRKKETFFSSCTCNVRVSGSVVYIYFPFVAMLKNTFGGLDYRLERFRSVFKYPFLRQGFTLWNDVGAPDARVLEREISIEHRVKPAAGLSVYVQIENCVLAVATDARAVVNFSVPQSYIGFMCRKIELSTGLREVSFESDGSKWNPKNLFAATRVCRYLGVTACDASLGLPWGGSADFKKQSYPLPRIQVDTFFSAICRPSKEKSGCRWLYAAEGGSGTYISIAERLEGSKELPSNRVYNGGFTINVPLSMGALLVSAVRWNILWGLSLSSSGDSQSHTANNSLAQGPADVCGEGNDAVAAAPSANRGASLFFFCPSITFQLRDLVACADGRVGDRVVYRAKLLQPSYLHKLPVTEGDNVFLEGSLGTLKLEAVAEERGRIELATVDGCAVEILAAGPSGSAVGAGGQQRYTSVTVGDTHINAENISNWITLLKGICIVDSQRSPSREPARYSASRRNSSFVSQSTVGLPSTLSGLKRNAESCHEDGATPPSLSVQLMRCTCAFGTDKSSARSLFRLSLAEACVSLTPRTVESDGVWERVLISLPTVPSLQLLDARYPDKSTYHSLLTQHPDKNAPTDPSGGKITIQILSRVPSTNGFSGAITRNTRSYRTIQHVAMPNRVVSVTARDFAINVCGEVVESVLSTFIEIWSTVLNAVTASLSRQKEVPLQRCYTEWTAQIQNIQVHVAQREDKPGVLLSVGTAVLETGVSLKNILTPAREHLSVYDTKKRQEWKPHAWHLVPRVFLRDVNLGVTCGTHSCEMARVLRSFVSVPCIKISTTFAMVHTVFCRMKLDPNGEEIEEDISSPDWTPPKGDTPLYIVEHLSAEECETMKFWFPVETSVVVGAEEDFAPDAKPSLQRAPLRVSLSALANVLSVYRELENCARQITALLRGASIPMGVVQLHSEALAEPCTTGEPFGYHFAVDTNVVCPVQILSSESGVGDGGMAKECGDRLLCSVIAFGAVHFVREVKLPRLESDSTVKASDATYNYRLDIPALNVVDPLHRRILGLTTDEEAKDNVENASRPSVAASAFADPSDRHFSLMLTGFQVGSLDSLVDVGRSLIHCGKAVNENKSEVTPALGGSYTFTGALCKMEVEVSHEVKLVLRGVDTVLERNPTGGRTAHISVETFRLAQGESTEEQLTLLHAPASSVAAEADLVEKNVSLAVGEVTIYSVDMAVFLLLSERLRHLAKKVRDNCLSFAAGEGPRGQPTQFVFQCAMVRFFLFESRSLTPPRSDEQVSDCCCAIFSFGDIYAKPTSQGQLGVGPAATVKNICARWVDKEKDSQDFILLEGTTIDVTVSPLGNASRLQTIIGLGPVKGHLPAGRLAHRMACVILPICKGVQALLGGHQRAESPGMGKERCVALSCALVELTVLDTETATDIAALGPTLSFSQIAFEESTDAKFSNRRGWHLTVGRAVGSYSEGNTQGLNSTWLEWGKVDDDSSAIREKALSAKRDSMALSSTQLTNLPVLPPLSSTSLCRTTTIESSPLRLTLPLTLVSFAVDRVVSPLSTAICSSIHPADGSHACKVLPGEVLVSTIKALRLVKQSEHYDERRIVLSIDHDVELSPLECLELTQSSKIRLHFVRNGSKNVITVKGSSSGSGECKVRLQLSEGVYGEVVRPITIDEGLTVVFEKVTVHVDSCGTGDRGDDFFGMAWIGERSFLTVAPEAIELYTAPLTSVPDGVAGASAPLAEVERCLVVEQIAVQLSGSVCLRDGASKVEVEWSANGQLRGMQRQVSADAPMQLEGYVVLSINQLQCGAASALHAPRQLKIALYPVALNGADGGETLGVKVEGEPLHCTMDWPSLCLMYKVARLVGRATFWEAIRACERASRSGLFSSSLRRPSNGATRRLKYCSFDMFLPLLSMSVVGPLGVELCKGGLRETNCTGTAEYLSASDLTMALQTNLFLEDEPVHCPPRTLAAVSPLVELTFARLGGGGRLVSCSARVPHVLLTAPLNSLLKVWKEVSELSNHSDLRQSAIPRQSTGSPIVEPGFCDGQVKVVLDNHDAVLLSSRELEVWGLCRGETEKHGSAIGSMDAVGVKQTGAGLHIDSVVRLRNDFHESGQWMVSLGEGKGGESATVGSGEEISVPFNVLLLPFCVRVNGWRSPAVSNTLTTAFLLDAVTLCNTLNLSSLSAAESRGLENIPLLQRKLAALDGHTIRWPLQLSRGKMLPSSHREDGASHRDNEMVVALRMEWSLLRRWNGRELFHMPLYRYKLSVAPLFSLQNATGCRLEIAIKGCSGPRAGKEGERPPPTTCWEQLETAVVDHNGCMEWIPTNWDAVAGCTDIVLLIKLHFPGSTSALWKVSSSISLLQGKTPPFVRVESTCGKFSGAISLSRNKDSTLTLRAAGMLTNHVDRPIFIQSERGNGGGAGEMGNVLSANASAPLFYSSYAVTAIPGASRAGVRLSTAPSAPASDPFYFDGPVKWAFLSCALPNTPQIKMFVSCAVDERRDDGRQVVEVHLHACCSVRNTHPRLTLFAQSCSDPGTQELPLSIALPTETVQLTLFPTVKEAVPMVRFAYGDAGSVSALKWTPPIKVMELCASSTDVLVRQWLPGDAASELLRLTSPCEVHRCPAVPKKEKREATEKEFICVRLRAKIMAGKSLPHENQGGMHIDVSLADHCSVLVDNRLSLSCYVTQSLSSVLAKGALHHLSLKKPPAEPTYAAAGRETCFCCDVPVSGEDLHLTVALPSNIFMGYSAKVDVALVDAAASRQSIEIGQSGAFVTVLRKSAASVTQSLETSDVYVVLVTQGKQIQEWLLRQPRLLTVLDVCIHEVTLFVSAISVTAGQTSVSQSLVGAECRGALQCRGRAMPRTELEEDVMAHLQRREMDLIVFRIHGGRLQLTWSEKDVLLSAAFSSLRVFDTSRPSIYGACVAEIGEREHECDHGVAGNEPAVELILHAARPEQLRPPLGMDAGGGGEVKTHRVQLYSALLQVATIRVDLHDGFLFTFRTAATRFLSEITHYEELQRSEARPLPIPRKTVLLIDRLSFSPVQVVLSLTRGSTGGLDPFQGLPWLRSRVIPSIDNLHIHLPAVSLCGVTVRSDRGGTGARSLISLLWPRYKYHSLVIGLRAVGSLDVLGSPSTLLRGWSEAFDHLLQRRGTGEEDPSSVWKGTTAFLRISTASTLHSVSLIASSLGAIGYSQISESARSREGEGKAAGAIRNPLTGLLRRLGRETERLSKYISGKSSFNRHLEGSVKTWQTSRDFVSDSKHEAKTDGTAAEGVILDSGELPLLSKEGFEDARRRRTESVRELITAVGIRSVALHMHSTVLEAELSPSEYLEAHSFLSIRAVSDELLLLLTSNCAPGGRAAEIRLRAAQRQANMDRAFHIKQSLGAKSLRTYVTPGIIADSCSPRELVDLVGEEEFQKVYGPLFGVSLKESLQDLVGLSRGV